MGSLWEKRSSWSEALSTAHRWPYQWRHHPPLGAGGETKDAVWHRTSGNSPTSPTVLCLLTTIPATVLNFLDSSPPKKLVCYDISLTFSKGHQPSFNLEVETRV